MARVGVLTGGGDAPGLNPAIRAIVRAAYRHDWQVIAFLGGWRGILENQTRALPMEGVDDLLWKGGTAIGTSRTNPYKEKDGTARIRESMRANRLDALIAIGGEDTLGVAAKLHAEKIPVVGVAKTIDNDLDATDATIGFATAVDIVTEAFDRLRTTAESHDRVIVVEIMGRHAGWLAAVGGLAGGADATLVPEFPTPVSEVLKEIESCRKRGKNYALIAVAEGARILGDDGKEISGSSGGATDAFGHVRLGGIGEQLAALIRERTGYDTRATVLGHLQRGGSPCAADRILGTVFGLRAMELVVKREFGKVPVLSGGRILTVPLTDAVRRLKTLSPAFYELAKGLFG